MRACGPSFEVQEHGGGVRMLEVSNADALESDLEVAVERHDLALLGPHDLNQSLELLFLLLTSLPHRR